MSRWIVILLLFSALVTFALVSGVLILMWIRSEHASLFAWLLVTSDVLVFWIGLGYVRFRLHEAREEARQQPEASDTSGVGYLADVSGAGAAAAANDLSASATPLGS